MKVETSVLAFFACQLLFESQIAYRIIKIRTESMKYLSEKNSY
ncbi:hypothetical protein HMPREF9397_1347 [Streptococcus sanguinis SK1087]|uniref:Uncharacterized protein n=1 Tax=Streptococcus sanguinis SK1087 TaxID=888824 RepID=F3SJM5_STRSA|nr:hypothetical protein HMPREF9397_1347 [Streptococcus sanguinis SK1087]